MNKKILSVVEEVANEKLVSREKIFKALELALSIATQKKYKQDIEVRVNINRQSGCINTFRRWLIVSNVLYPKKEITLEAVKLSDSKLKIGEYIEDEIESIKFDRIATQTAKQIIFQKVREAECEMIMEQFNPYKGKIISGIIKEICASNIIIDLGNNVEAFIIKKEMLPRENLHVGDNIKGILYDIKLISRKVKLFISRSRTKMLIELFKIEVPEIKEKVVIIKSIAREPGLRSKVIVLSNDIRIDPIGACIGVRGSRVKAVSNELCGERIDIILWSENIAQLVVNSMVTSNIFSMVINEEKRHIDISVDINNLSQTIGKSGSNVKLASKITGWTLNILTLDNLKNKYDNEVKDSINLFVKNLNINKNIAFLLIKRGFFTIESLAYIDENELYKINEIDKNITKSIIKKAKNILLKSIIIEKFNSEINKSKFDNVNKFLIVLPNITKNIALKLVHNKIYTLENLAEQSIEDLSCIKELSKKKAGELIMTARNICWFNNK
ncbi:MAG: transcription termination factor NusA [Enterobacterales bacterium]